MFNLSKKIQLAISVSAFLTLSGCSVFTPGGSSDFGCQGMPKGVSCKNPMEVYELSNAQQNKATFNPGPVAVTFGTSVPSEPIPVLEQAKIMRIWIAPWEDSRKDLHWPGLVFTQIQPRQWSIGDSSFNGVEPRIPHLMTQESQAASAPPSALPQSSPPANP